MKLKKGDKLRVKSVGDRPKYIIHDSFWLGDILEVTEPDVGGGSFRIKSDQLSAWNLEFTQIGDYFELIL